VILRAGIPMGHGKNPERRPLKRLPRSPYFSRLLGSRRRS
jgi:hypothetical protein